MNGMVYRHSHVITYYLSLQNLRSEQNLLTTAKLIFSFSLHARRTIGLAAEVLFRGGSASETNFCQPDIVYTARENVCPNESKFLREKVNFGARKEVLPRENKFGRER